MNGSQTERFAELYQAIWAAFRAPDAPDLTQHERELLHHVPTEGGIPLTWIARHLALPKSTASVLVKDLERRGFVRRMRDTTDGRRLAIVLTAKGRRRVESDTVLDVRKLSSAMAAVPRRERETLFSAMERLATAAPDRAERSAGR